MSQPKPTPPPELASLWRAEGYLRTIKNCAIVVTLLLCLQVAVTVVSSMIAIGAAAVQVADSSSRRPPRAQASP
jgi:hypothetical protein